MLQSAALRSTAILCVLSLVPMVLTKLPQNAQDRSAMARERLSVSYEPDADAPDLREVLERLRKLKGTPYTGRSLADIGGMILAEYAPRELAKYLQEEG